VPPTVVNTSLNSTLPMEARYTQLMGTNTRLTKEMETLRESARQREEFVPRVG